MSRYLADRVVKGGRRRGCAAVDVMAHPFMVAASEWLGTGAARRYAEREMARLRVHVAAEDVLADAKWKIWQRLRNDARGLDASAAERYCRTVIRSVVVDLLRGFGSDPIERWPVPDGSRSRQSEVVAPPLIGIADSGVADTLRLAIESTAQFEPWVTSAALSFVTLTQYPEVDVSGAPRPRAGARPDQARMWPCLWLAGKVDGVFPAGRSTPAQRKRLSRATAQVMDLVHQAASATRLTGVVS